MDSARGRFGSRVPAGARLTQLQTRAVIEGLALRRPAVNAAARR